MENNYNIFICYRGTSDDTDKNKIDGKWAALDLYSELSKVDEFRCFFAPKHFEPHDDFKYDIPAILQSVKVAVLVLTVGFFDRCGEEDDIVTYELNEILSRDITIIPVPVDRYSIVEDRGKIETYFKGKADRFFHRVGCPYPGIYGFNPNDLKKSIFEVLALYDNQFPASEIDENNILSNIGYIINSSSVTVALNKIISILEEKLSSEPHLNMKQLRQDTESLIDRICKSVVHFSMLKNAWEKQIKPILSQKQTNAAMALRNYKVRNQANRNKVSDFSKGLFQKKDGILTFSQSEYVIDFLSSYATPVDIKNACTIYICEGRSKCQFYFEDAQEIYEKLKQSKFKNRTVITDCSIHQLLEEKKITKILLGACSVELRDSILRSFINAAGTETILMLAEKFNIPVYVISASNKHLEKFIPRELQLSIKEFKKKHSEVPVDAVDYVKVQRTPNITFISERGLDNAKMTKYFYEDIFKDNREAADGEDGRFIKICNKTEYTIEHLVLDALEKAGCNVAGLIDFSDASRRLEMKRVKGVRLFELFYVLDELAHEGLRSAVDAKERLLSRCNAAQKSIWHTLSSLKFDSPLPPYPNSKIKELLIELAHSITIYYPDEPSDCSIEQMSSEADALYRKFERCARIPFRDSTVKNMAINIEALDGLDNIKTEDAKDKMKAAIRSFLSKDNFDNYDIIDFDFSSCKNLTTVYDDYIGLNLHESTYNLNTENHILKTYCGNEEFVISLFIRYLRFAGRKRLYRLLCPTFHDVRFKYDDERFYFKKFIFLVGKLDPEFQNNYPNIYRLFCTLSRLPNVTPKFDMVASIYHLEAQPWLGLWKPV